MFPPIRRRDTSLAAFEGDVAGKAGGAAGTGGGEVDVGEGEGGGDGAGDAGGGGAGTGSNCRIVALSHPL